MAYLGYGVWSLVVSVLAGEAFLSLVYLSQVKAFPKASLKLSRISSILKYGFGMMGSRLLVFGNTRLGVFVSGLSFGERQTGYYQFDH